MDDIIAIGLANETLQEDAYTFLLARTTWDKLFEIDKMIEQTATNWKKHRISKVSLSVLRLALCEMYYIDETPLGVAVHEAVELCKSFATAQDAAFVNGILNTLAKPLEAQESPDAEQ